MAPHGQIINKSKMLQRPKNTKYKKYQKGRISFNIRTNQNWKNINKFRFGIMALEPFRVTAGNIWAIDLAIKRKLKSKNLKGVNTSSSESIEQETDTSAVFSTSQNYLKEPIRYEGTGLEIRLFPHLPVTKKPIETRMGKGKGNIEYWMSRVKAGAILVEYNCSNINLGKQISKIVNSKLPIKTKFIYRS